MPDKAAKKPYRIISFDGGGIRGVFSATLIEEMDKQQKGFWQDFDLYAGTSTGGIIALALAAGIEPPQIRELYEQNGSKVFEHPIPYPFSLILQPFMAAYTHKNLKRLLIEWFGDKTLGDLKKRVMITSFDLVNPYPRPGRPRMWKPKFFTNFPTPGEDSGEKIVDVALRTSAAPTFFPIYQGYTDGGVAANDPSMAALAQALDKNTGQQVLKNVVLLSVGAGLNAHYLNVKRENWGWLQWFWGLLVINIMFDGSLGVAEYQCSRILEERYHRLNPALDQDVALDEVSAIPYLVEAARGAQSQISQTYKWVRKYT
jgi:patatin-like phospholipase/acyl hydrolase